MKCMQLRLRLKGDRDTAPSGPEVEAVIVWNSLEPFLLTLYGEINRLTELRMECIIASGTPRLEVLGVVDVK